LRNKRPGAQVPGRLFWLFGTLCARLRARNKLVATDPKAYAFRVGKNSKPPGRIREGHMKLIALLMYVAEQKQKSLDTVEQLFKRLMLPRKD